MNKQIVALFLLFSVAAIQTFTEPSKSTDGQPDSAADHVERVLAQFEGLVIFPAESPVTNGSPVARVSPITRVSPVVMRARNANTPNENEGTLVFAQNPSPVNQNNRFGEFDVLIGALHTMNAEQNPHTSPAQSHVSDDYMLPIGDDFNLDNDSPN